MIGRALEAPSFCACLRSWLQLLCHLPQGAGREPVAILGMLS